MIAAAVCAAMAAAVAEEVADSTVILSHSDSFTPFMDDANVVESISGVVAPDRAPTTCPFSSVIAPDCMIGECTTERLVLVMESGLIVRLKTGVSDGVRLNTGVSPGVDIDAVGEEATDMIRR